MEYSKSIRLGGEWYIDIDQYNYALVRKDMTKPSRDRVKGTYGYHRSLRSAIDAYLKLNFLSGEEVLQFNNIVDDFETATQKAIDKFEHLINERETV